MQKPSPFGSRNRRRLRVPPGDAVAKMIIPRLDAQLYVVEGDGASQLRRGPGHVMGTVMPGQSFNLTLLFQDVPSYSPILYTTRVLGGPGAP